MTNNTCPIILLTGKPGSGKTTAVRAIVAQLHDRAGGFYTHELRRGPARAGFEIVTLDGQKALLAAKGATFEPRAQVGSYHVNLQAIEEVAVPSLRRAAADGKIVVVDEIGPMELLSAAFRHAIGDLLDVNDVTLVGTIVQRPHDFADRVKTHPRATLHVITPDNRDQIPALVCSALAVWLG